jgi:hypothetical protein
MARATVVNMRFDHCVALVVLLIISANEARCAESKTLAPTTIQAPSPANEVWINLKEDEIILPPYLVKFDGGPVLNAFSESGPVRSLDSKELLEYGDRFRLLPSLALQVWGRDHFQWVGGGVFQGAFFGPKIRKGDNAYGVRLERGWLRVWLEEATEYAVWIETPNGRLIANRAHFWVYSQNSETEVFLLEGSIKGPGGDGQTDYKAGDEPLYLKWKSGSKDPETSRSWDPDRIERRIKLVYPELWKLVQSASKDWDSELGKETYQELRKSGWRHSTRFAPKK